MNTQCIIDYLSALDANNNREWYHANKEDLKTANAEFEGLLQALILEIGKFDDSIIHNQPKDLTFKMVRDTRFSHDKSPYNPAFRAHISSKGKLPVPVGYYLMIKPGNQSFLGGGLFADMFKDATTMIRDYISRNGNEWEKIIHQPEFEKYFTVRGTALKNVPAGYEKEHPQADYLKFKSWYLEYPLKDEEVKKVLFRDKSKYGFKYSMMTLESENKKYSRGVETDPYLRAFFGDLSDRPSCYHCAFKKQYHESDFTIWDCFIAENFDKNLDDDKGTSRVLVNSKKGQAIFEEIKEQFHEKEVAVEDLVRNVKEMSHSVELPAMREEFFKDINQMEEKDFFEKYFKDTVKVKCERSVRIFLAKTGIYKNIKRLAKRILKK